MTLTSNEDFELLEKKREKIISTKQNFENKILSKIGDALLGELFSLRSGENPPTSKQKQTIKVKIPSEIRSFIEKIENNEVIIETAILYFLYNINHLTEELTNKYQENKTFLINKINDPEFSNKSDDLYRLFTKFDEIIINFIIPDYIIEKFTLLGKEFEVLIIYGILAIIKWLNLITINQDEIFNEYEQYFLEYIKKFN